MITKESNGLHNGSTIYCPVDAYGDCPYCDQENKCYVLDPIEDCEDFGMFYEDWEEWERENS